MIHTCSRGFVEGRCNDCYPTRSNLCCMASLEGEILAGTETLNNSFYSAVTTLSPQLMHSLQNKF